MRYFLIILLFGIIFSSYADEKRALKFLSKQEYDKLIELLDKDIDKDSLNPGSYYVYSLLYDDSLYSHQSLDSSYYYILLCDSLYKLTDQKSLDKLNKININDSSIAKHKIKLDALGYERAVGEHTLSAYNSYLDQFNTSSYIPDAIEDRNSLAFQQVSSIHTYKGYWDYMLDYPQSTEYIEAKKRYQKLLYEYYARDDQLDDYMEFISKYQESPYVEKAIQNIYRLRTIDNTERSYLDFIRDFPGTQPVKNAINRLYHNYLESGNTDFSYQYNFLELNDSIITISEIDGQYLIPSYENDHYGFMNEKGELLLPYLYENIDQAYLCGNIMDNYLIVTLDENRIIISRTGEVIYDKNFIEINDIGNGLLKIKKENKYGLVYKSGESVIPASFDDIQLLDQHFLKLRKENMWYLYSHNGMQILPYGFTEIDKEEWFLLLKQGSKWAVLNNEIPFELRLLDDPSINFIYDDIELIEDTQLLCFTGDKEVVLGKDLEQLLPMEEQNIFTLPDGWLIKKDSIYNLYDDAFVKVSGTGFTEVIYKGSWMAGKKDSSWVLYQNFAPYPDVFVYDSVKILSNGCVLVYQNDSQFLIFLNQKKIELGDYASINILRSSIENSEDNEPVEFLVIDFERKKSIVYNQRGEQVIKADPGSIQLLGNEYFKTSQKKKTGLSDTTGKVLLKPLYDAIANYENGFVSILSNKKFGIYNKKSGIFLKPKYDRLLKPYNDHFLIAHMVEGLGLIDPSGESVTPFEYEEIEFWNDSSFMARIDDEWHIIDIFSNEYILEGITDYSQLKNGKEKVLLIRKDDMYGIVSNTEGVIINPTFTDIIPIGSEDFQIYFAEKYIQEAEFYIVIYYNSIGEILRKQVFSDEEYDKIYCN